LKLDEGAILEYGIFNRTFELYRSSVVALLNDLAELTSNMEEEGLTAAVAEITRNVGEPFLFVVVGEIKAGKSSFINALLGSNICRVDPAPCTDTIEQIVYASERTETQLSPYQRRIGIPAEVLRHISIVDTPGTNTVIEHHHEITEKFIPNSGLVLFVFPTKNPHTATAWQLLEFISNEWRKLVVFILQQSDLATEKELRVNTEKVREYAAARGMTAPLVFAVSAKWEAEGNSASGFEAVRAYIRETVTGGRHQFLKLTTTLTAAEKVLEQVYANLENAKTRLDTDRETAANIARDLENGRKDIEKEIALFVNNLVERYDRIGLEIKSDFEEGLSITALYKRAIRGSVSRAKSVSFWLESLQLRFEGRLTTALTEAAAERSWPFIQTVQKLFSGVDAALQRIAISQPNQKQGITWDKKRIQLVEEIRQKTAALAATDLFCKTLAENPAAMPSRLVSGGTLTLIGALMMATHFTILDITGGILAGLGLLLTGAVLITKRGKIIREFNRVIAEGREKLRNKLTEQLHKRFSDLHEEISRSMRPFLNQITEDEKRLAALVAQGQQIQQHFDDLSERILADMGAEG
jgi:ribosome biogenesis GTPase A